MARTIEQTLDTILARLDMFEEKIDKLDKKVEDMGETVKNMGETVKNMDEKIDVVTNGLAILSAKQINSSAARMDKLVKVPLKSGKEACAEYPDSIMQLLLAGNELLPDGNPNAWNLRKSRKLLAEFDVGISDSEASDNESSRRSRTARLKVAKVMGISQVQLNYAQLHL